MRKPQALREGSTIAVLSLSDGAANRFPETYQQGLTALTNMGYNIKEFPNSTATDKYLHDNPKKRAEEFNQAIQDNEVDAIISIIGGEESIRILKYLDTEAFLNNPKIVMGYSDATAYLAYLSSLGAVTFNGPAIMAGLAQAHNFPKYEKHIQEMLRGPETPYEYPEYTEFTSGYPHWGDTDQIGGIQEKQTAPSTRWLQGETTQGKLWGGCWEVLEMMRGTQFWPQKTFFKNKILFLEMSDVPQPQFVRYSLRGYAQAGIFDELAGIVVGRAKGYSSKQQDILDESLLQVAHEVGRDDLSIATNISFGHTDPQIILPHNCEARMSKDKSLTLLESPLQ